MPGRGKVSGGNVVLRDGNRVGHVENSMPPATRHEHHLSRTLETLDLKQPNFNFSTRLVAPCAAVVAGDKVHCYVGFVGMHVNVNAENTGGFFSGIVFIIILVLRFTDK